MKTIKIEYDTSPEEAAEIIEKVLKDCDIEYNIEYPEDPEIIIRYNPKEK